MRLRRGSQPSATLFDYDEKIKQQGLLQTKMGDAEFWDDQDSARLVINKYKLLKAQTERAHRGAKYGWMMHKLASN